MLQHIRYLVLQHVKFLSGDTCLKNKFGEKVLPVLEGCLPYRLLVLIYEWKTQVSFLWQNSSWVHESCGRFPHFFFFFVLLFFMKSRKKIINPNTPPSTFIHLIRLVSMGKYSRSSKQSFC